MAFSAGASIESAAPFRRAFSVARVVGPSLSADEARDSGTCSAVPVRVRAWLLLRYSGIRAGGRLRALRSRLCLETGAAKRRPIAAFNKFPLQTAGGSSLDVSGWQPGTRCRLSRREEADGDGLRLAAVGGRSSQTLRLPSETVVCSEALAHICTRVPSSTTALPGKPKNSSTPIALRLMVAKSRSRQFAMPPRRVGTTFSRLRK